MAKFNIGDIVRTIGGQNPDRIEGVIKHFTCEAATKSGGSKCDRKTCPHKPKNRYWVKWPNDTIFSYKVSELETDDLAEEETIAELADAIAGEEPMDDVKAVKTLQKIMKSRKARKINSAVEASEERLEEEEKSMVKENSFTGMIKKDATNAAYRVAAKQINTGVRSAIIEVLKKKGANSTQIEGITMFIESELGAALLSTATGYGLSYAPVINKDPRAQRLATEFRINGMATAGNALVEALFGQFMPVITDALNALPAAEEEAVEIETSTPARLESRTNEAEEFDIEIEEDTSLLEASIEKQAKRVGNGG